MVALGSQTTEAKETIFNRLMLMNRSAAQPRELATDTRKWTGDFDGMMRRRHIRIVVPYSRRLYFNAKGSGRGLTADNARDFERYINQKYKNQLGNRPSTVYLVPTTRDLLLQKVADGREVRLRPVDARGSGIPGAQLNQDAKSHVGAIGVMQLIPATGAGMKSATAKLPKATSMRAPSTWII